jgi:hypothetical protein
LAGQGQHQGERCRSQQTVKSSAFHRISPKLPGA